MLTLFQRQKVNIRSLTHPVLTLSVHPKAVSRYILMIWPDKFYSGLVFKFIRPKLYLVMAFKTAQEGSLEFDKYLIAPYTQCTILSPHMKAYYLE